MESGIVVCGWLRVEPSERDTYLRTCVEVVNAGRVAEGCLDFAVSPDLVDLGRINIFERWSSQEAAEAFRGNGTPGEQMTMIVSAEVSEHHVSGSRDLT